MFELPTTPLSIGQVLDLSIKNYLRNFRLVLPLVLAAIVVSCANLTAQMEFRNQPAATAIVALILYIPAVYIGMALLSLLWGTSLDEPLSMGEALGLAARKLLPIILYYILLSLAVTGGLILLVIPGIILAVTLVLGQYAIIIENAGPVEALKRSHSLVWGNWGRTAAVLTVVVLIYIAVDVVFGLVVGVASLGRNPATIAIIVGILTGTMSSILAPFTVSAGLVLFADLRLRKEGADLEEAIDNL